MSCAEIQKKLFFLSLFGQNLKIVSAFYNNFSAFQTFFCEVVKVWFYLTWAWKALKISHFDVAHTVLEHIFLWLGKILAPVDVFE